MMYQGRFPLLKYAEESIPYAEYLLDPRQHADIVYQKEDRGLKFRQKSNTKADLACKSSVIRLYHKTIAACG